MLVARCQVKVVFFNPILPLLAPELFLQPLLLIKPKYVFCSIIQLQRLQLVRFIQNAF